MSGTIVIDAATFVDVRTVDFLRIVEALRAERGGAAAIDRLLDSVDECGLNMICADELDAAGLAAFGAILERLRRTVREDDPFGAFLADLASTIRADARLLSNPKMRPQA